MALGTNRVIRMVAPSTAQTRPVGPVKQEDIEANWAKSVTTREGILEAGGRLPFSVSMSGRGMDDAVMKRWCDWFESHYGKVSTGKELIAREMNFSNNQLTAAGIKHLTSMLMRKNIHVSILKFYQNHIAKVAEVVEFLHWSSGNVKEIHLSHNRLDAAAAHDVVIAAVTAKDAKDEPCYPRYGGYARVPLWLRLEKNFIDAAGLDSLLITSLKKLGIPMSKAICHVNGTTECNPGVCNSCKGSVAAVHLTHITHQERSSNVPSIRALPTPQKTPGKSDPGVRTLPKAASSGTPKAAAKPSRGWGQKQETDPEATPTETQAEDTAEAFPALQSFPALSSSAPLQSFPALASSAPKLKERKNSWQVADDPPEEAPLPAEEPTLRPPPPPLAPPPKMNPASLPTEKQEEEVASEACVDVEQKEQTRVDSPQEDEIAIDDFPSLPSRASSKSNVGRESKQASPSLPESKQDDFPSLPSRSSSKCDVERESNQAPTPSSQVDSKQDDFPSLPSRSSSKCDVERESKQAPAPSSQMDSKQVDSKPSFVALVKSSGSLDNGDSTPCQVDSVSEFPSLPSAPQKKKKKGGIKIVAQEPKEEKNTITESEKPVEKVALEHPEAKVVLPLEERSVAEDSLSREEPSVAETRDKVCGQIEEDAFAEEQHTGSDLQDTQPVEKSMMVVNTYFAEATGYLSVERGDRVQAVSAAVDGDVGCKWQSYIFCETRSGEPTQGWLPEQVLWELYYDEAGREWITDVAVGEWRWVDEFLCS